MSFPIERNVTPPADRLATARAEYRRQRSLAGRSDALLAGSDAAERRRVIREAPASIESRRRAADAAAAGKRRVLTARPPT